MIDNTRISQLEKEKFTSDANGDTSLRVVTSQIIPASGVNPALTLGYDGVGNLVSEIKTINGISYEKILTYDGVGNLTDVSAWIKL